MKVLFLDLDGTVRLSTSGGIFIAQPENQKIINGVKEAIACYKNDWLIMGITNQAGVINQHKSLENCIKEQQLTMQLLPELYKVYACPDWGETMLIIDRLYYSRFDGKLKHKRDITDNQLIPSSQQFNYDSFRKPGIGMIQYFINNHSSISKAIFVGDMESDRQCAKKANIEFIWAEDWRR